ncbi:hypothetical protein RF11_05671 [Thelohanellus kitauei]|uniref:Uncharacterized protein n=1 Tax=Thelohanellus kitauei TaxID=669202 RepID=A0A0C2MER3_THEKT|nr:hypothetical protein RF11_05671 [Thelohanellus kitauei]
MKKNCNASLKTNIEKTEIISPATQHEHPPNPNANSVRRIRHNMRTLALTTAARPRQIISSTLRDSTPELSAIIPNTPSLNANIQRLRKRTAFPYIFPTNAIEFIVQDEYKNTYHEECFLFSDTFAPSEEQETFFKEAEMSILTLHSKQYREYVSNCLQFMPNLEVTSFHVYLF